MTSVGNNINSYDFGEKPYRHDVNRGRWTSISDFYLGCIGNAFGIKCFTILPFFISYNGGILFIIPYTLALFLFALPIFIFQSFLGQFSSSGFISVFRISPLFKGIGYVILVFNIASICYMSAIISYPLIYFFASMSPFTLPWMSCNNSFNTPNCTVDFELGSENDTYVSIYKRNLTWSPVEFLEFVISENNKHSKVTKIVWPIFFCTILIWILLGVIFYKGFEAVTNGIRYCISISLILFAIVFIRIICLPSAFDVIISFLTPPNSFHYHIDILTSSPFVAVFIFGSGWGTILTLSSFNNFKADTIHYSKIVGFLLMILFGMSVLASNIIEENLYEHYYVHSDDIYLLDFILVGFPYVLGHLEMSHLWCLIFFGMLFLCEFCGLIIQMLSILTAIFDEYENLREEKKRISIGLVGCLGVLSLIFTTNKDVSFYQILVCFIGFTQLSISLIELIVVVWFYGRLRFQRDIQFMLGRTFATWKFFIIRFITPLFILIILFLFFLFLIGAILYYDTSIFDIALLLLVKLLPWICIPVCVIIKLLNTTGTFCHRFKKSIWPTDWYPADSINRQRYEETLGSSDISHQLVIMKPDDEECN